MVDLQNSLIYKYVRTKVICFYNAQLNHSLAKKNNSLQRIPSPGEEEGEESIKVVV